MNIVLSLCLFSYSRTVHCSIYPCTVCHTWIHKTRRFGKWKEQLMKLWSISWQMAGEVKCELHDKYRGGGFQNWCLLCFWKCGKGRDIAGKVKKWKTFCLGRRLMVKGTTYCPLLRSIQMNCSAWLLYSNDLYCGQWKTEHVKNVRLYHCITLPLVAIVMCFVL